MRWPSARSADQSHGSSDVSPLVSVTIAPAGYRDSGRPPSARLPPPARRTGSTSSPADADSGPTASEHSTPQRARPPRRPWSPWHHQHAAPTRKAHRLISRRSVCASGGGYLELSTEPTVPVPVCCAIWNGLSIQLRLCQPEFCHDTCVFRQVNTTAHTHRSPRSRSMAPNVPALVRDVDPHRKKSMRTSHPFDVTFSCAMIAVTGRCNCRDRPA